MRTLLITGGTGDLGAVVVPRLARDYRCLVHYRNEAKFAPLRDVPNVEGIASLERPDDEGLYGVVSLAGGFAAGSNAAAIERMIDANVIPFANAIDAALPHLEEGGRIVAISSFASTHHPAGLAAYTASKAALNAIVVTLAGELADRRITSNALLPSSLATPGATGRTIPLERVAEWIAFLLSDAGEGVTGQLIELVA